jgi:AcrR family transcriptional regulator
VQNVLVTSAAETPRPSGSRPEEQGSARKRELLEAAYRYVLSNGLAGMSLRPLAKQIGSSPRVLLFLFGSKEGLTRALVARAREDELAYLETLRSSRAAGQIAGAGADGLAAAGREVWGWLAAPSHRALLGLWLEGYARSLQSEPGPWAEFGSDTVRDWLELLAAWQRASSPDAADTPDPADDPGAEDERTLLLAVLRGALLDLLATGDADRVSRAVEGHLRSLEH